MTGAKATPDKTSQTNAIEVRSHGSTRVESMANINYQHRYKRGNTYAKEATNSEHVF